MTIGNGRLILGDCLVALQTCPASYFNMVFADLPYGVTACPWDTVIPFDALWAALRRVCKPNAAMVFTATQPFASALVASNFKEFKYEWIWDKITATGFQNAERRPLQQHEQCLVFANGGGTHGYTPIMEPRQRLRRGGGPVSNSGVNPLSSLDGKTRTYSEKYPKTILTYSGADHSDRKHPSEKPVPLVSYFLRTYSQPGDRVLDPTCGSATTAIAAELTGRKWVCIEKDPDIFAAALVRVQAHIKSHQNSFGILNA